MELKNRNIDQIISEMTLEEKASLCSGKDFWHLKGVERLGIPSIMVTDGPHGLRKQAGKGDHVGLGKSVPATCFPTAVTLASSWDRDLLKEVGEALGEECLQEKVSVLLGPGANIKRNPLCGRNFEYFSEDPYLTGELAASMIEGVQSKGIGTSLKHFAANNQEYCRMTIDTIVDERTLRELYLSGFEKAVRQSQPWTVMNAYNRLNGEFCSENLWLLNNVLKEEWGHEGLVVTDWGAENDRVEGLKAGQELEMPGGSGLNDAKILEAVRKGELSKIVLDERVKRILQLILKSEAPLQNEYKYDKTSHHELAVRAASESMVLLKNEGSILPLKKEGTIAIIGDFAKNPRYQGAGSSQILPTQIDTALDAFKKTGNGLFETLYAQGFSTKEDVLEKNLIEEAVSLSRKADQTVIFAGLPPSFESEGFDRNHMSLPSNQLALIDEILKVSPDAVIVLSNGAPVEMGFINRCRGVIESYLGGQGGGTAVANLLFGETVPCGKIAETFPLGLQDIPSSPYFPGSPKQVLYKEGLYTGYRYFDIAGKDVLFPFGHGLSYTEFSYSNIRISSEKIRAKEPLTVSCTITNSGSHQGKEIVQLYVRDVESTVYRPEKELKGFEKIDLRPGESAEVTFELDERSFAFFDAKSRDWQIESGVFEILIGASSRDIRLKKEVTVQSDFVPERTEGDKIYKEIYSKIDNISNSDFEELLGRKIPEEDPVRPFHRNSTIQDICRTFIGRKVEKMVQKGFIENFGEMDESTMLMMENMIREMPLRSLTMLGGDQFNEKQLEGLLHLLNRRYIQGVLKLLKK